MDLTRFTLRLLLAVALGVTAAAAAPLPAAAATAFLGHESQGSGAAFTRRQEASARPLEFPGPAPTPAPHAQVAASSAAAPAASSHSNFSWSPGAWLAHGPGPEARPAYSGPQSPFPIYKDGYLPLADYNPAVGRLYIEISRTVLGECSATVVGRSVVLTAAHCLYDSSQRRFYSHFLFVPALHGRNAPDGAWRGHAQYILRAYAHHTAVSVDYGFLTLRPLHSRRIGKVTGWSPILANSRSRKILSLGYPASGVFARRCQTTSCYEWFCYSPLAARVRDRNGSYEVGMGCQSGEGSSGGPWFERYHHHWYIASSVSTGITFRPDPGYTSNQWGPYFNRNTLKLLRYANSHV